MALWRVRAWACLLFLTNNFYQLCQSFFFILYTTINHFMGNLCCEKHGKKYLDINKQQIYNSAFLCRGIFIMLLCHEQTVFFTFHTFSFFLHREKKVKLCTYRVAHVPMSCYGWYELIMQGIWYSLYIYTIQRQIF